MKKIIVIDDQEDILESLRRAGDFFGYTVETFSKFPGVGGIIERSPDVIFLDFLLGDGASGKDIAAEIKKNEHTKKIPLIMLSAYPNVNESMRNVVVDDFLAKPFSLNEFFTKAKYHMEKSKIKLT